MPRCALAFLIPLVACAPEPELEDKTTGRLELSWLVPDGCEDALVTDVDVVVGDQKLGTRPCLDGAWEPQKVRTGIHTVVFTGLDRYGDARYAAEARGVPVAEDETVPVATVILEALPAEVNVAWFFSNARLCSTNGADMVEVAAFENGTRVASAEAGCDLGAADLEGLPAGGYLLDVVARDELGRAIFHGEVEIEVGKGEGLDVEVELSPL